MRKVAGQSWDKVLHDRSFQPLDLKRTDATGDREKFENVARAYIVLDDLTPVEMSMIQMSGKTLLGGAGGVLSCVKDLLPLYKHMLKGAIHQFENDHRCAGQSFQTASDCHVCTRSGRQLQLPRVDLWTWMDA